MNTNQRFGRMVVILLTACAAVPARASLAQTAQPEPARQTLQGLPGGATSLQETHGDWRVACVQQKGRHVCALSQQQSDKETRQLVVAIELTAAAQDRTEATLILPFGLAVAKPVTLEIDEAAAGPPVSYKTCLPVGCLVSVTFDAATIARLRKATVLTVKAMADDGQAVAFKISLVGFSGAFDRTVTLAKSSL